MKHIVIVGGGCAGLSCALELQKKGFAPIIISDWSGASLISPWNMLIKEENELKKRMLKAGKNENDPKLLDIFVSHIKEAIFFLESCHISLKPSNLGLIPTESGARCLNKLKQIFIRKGAVVDGQVVGIKDGALLIKEKAEIKTLNPSVLIFACGGLASLYPFSTYVNSSINLIAHFSFLGIKCKHLRYNMFHPFLVVDKNLPRALISGPILSKMRFVDENMEEFLPDKIRNALRTDKYHGIFPEMCACFYKQKKKSRIYAMLEVGKEEFEEYKRNGDFGWIFHGRSLEEVRRFEISPAFHYSLGGFAVDNICQTNIDGIFACGECMAGLHGANRIGGLGVLEGIVFGRYVAEVIARERPEYSFNETLKFSKVPNEIKQLFWELVGVVKPRHELKKYLSIQPISPHHHFLKLAIEDSLNHEPKGLHIMG